MSILFDLDALQSTISQKWHKFWFKQVSVEPLALFRFFFGLFVLQVSLWELAPNFSLLFGNRAMFDTGAVSAFAWAREPLFNFFLLLPQEDLFRFGFFCLFLLFALFLTFGFCTQLSSIIVYLGLLSFDRQCPFVLDAGDDFMRVISFLLIFSPAGEAYSLDRFLQAKLKNKKLAELPKTLASPWLQRMIQIQVSIVYACAVLPKLFGPQWQSGLSVYYALQLSDFAKFQLPLAFSQFPFYKICTYYTLVVETCMFTLVWFKPLRYWVLLAAAIMHLGIDWSMNLMAFECLFVSSYILFIDDEDWHRLKNIFGRFFLRKKKDTISRELVTEKYNYLFLPKFTLLLIILLSGNLLTAPLREKYRQNESQQSYDARIKMVTAYWTEELTKYKNLPDYDERKMNAEEALGVMLSLNKDYEEGARLLRESCRARSEQQKPYNPQLITALSSLADLYLETGQLEACELIYKTLLQYDTLHSKYAPFREGVELNNLGIISYFRALMSDNKPDKDKSLTLADTYFQQAFNKSHNPKVGLTPGFRQIRAGILLNNYLALREIGKLKEAARARNESIRLSSCSKKTIFP